MPRRQSTPDEKAKQLAHRKAQAEHKGGLEAVRHAQAAGRAAELWGRGRVAWEHPYLARKGVRQHGLKVLDGLLLVPVRIDGALSSLQTIDAEGNKRFLPGGRVVSGLHLIGKPKALVYVVEGFATGASVHEATGKAVAVGFDCGNLRSVALAVHSKYPGSQIVVVADDDHETLGLSLIHI